MSYPATPDEPSPEDVDAIIAEIEQQIAETEPAGESNVVPVDLWGTEARTKRVDALVKEVGEARLIRAFQADPAPFEVDTPKVRRRQKRMREAERMHTLGQNPAALAWQAARWRLVLTVTALASLLLALGWSTAGVQKFAAGHNAPGTPQWILSWFAEPFLSLGLLTIVGAKAFMAMRGQPLDSKKLDRLEWMFLLLTLGMNAAPYSPWEATKANPFDFPTLVLHCLGPIVAVSVVTALPIIWAGFAGLDHGRAGTTGNRPGTAGTTSAVFGVGTTGNHPGGDDRVTQLAAQVRDAILRHDLPENPSRRTIQRFLRVRAELAAKVVAKLRT